MLTAIKCPTCHSAMYRPFGGDRIVCGQCPTVRTIDERTEFQTANLPPRLVEHDGDFYIHHKSLTYYPMSWPSGWRTYLDHVAGSDSWFELPEDWSVSDVQEIDRY